MKMGADLQPGNPFPDFALPDQEGSERQLRKLMDGWPTILVLWCGRY